jgi:hypothetical protein
VRDVAANEDWDVGVIGWRSPNISPGLRMRKKSHTQKRELKAFSLPEYCCDKSATSSRQVCSKNKMFSRFVM